jgi:GNAT superfamily N-acetyltransferase
MSARFQPATARDLDPLMQLVREFYAESGYSLPQGDARAAVERLISDPGLGRIWMIDVEGVRAGYLVLTLGWSIEYLGRDAFIDEIYLRPDFRGRGLGLQAMRFAEEEARVLGVRALHLEVERSNEAARRVYQERGFRDNERQLLSKWLEPA